MVVGIFPMSKLLTLFLKQVSKPIANFAKERAKHNYYFRTYVCMPPAQWYNWYEVRFKLWMLNMGKPDSIPRLNEQMAIELGANLLGETIVFVIGASLIVLEYSRQVRKDNTNKVTHQAEMEDVHNKIRDLSLQVESQDAQIRRLMHMMAEMDSKVIRIPWKGGNKHTADDKHEFKVTKEEAANFGGKDEDEKKR